MKQMDSLLCIGMADFAEPTLLLIGNADSLCWLADQIESRQELRLAELPSFVSTVKVGLRLVPATGCGRLIRLGDVFDWEISAVEAQNFVQQLRELAASTSPAHAYLDTESNVACIQVIASKGEYDPQRVFVR